MSAFSPRRALALGVLAPALVLLLLGAAPPAAQKKAAPAPAAAEAPDTFVEVTVRRVIPTDQGHAVVLSPKAGKSLMLPVFIGSCEANAIQMRLDRQTGPRPLTHELLDNVIRALGSKVVKVEIDDLRGGTFLGRIFLAQGDKVIQIDARPSDSIALALGAGAPIRVATKVLDQAGVDPSRPAETPDPASAADPGRAL